MTAVPIDSTISLDDLTRDPYPIYKRLRAQAPVLHVASVKRTFVTKAADTKWIKENPKLFSSDDPNTPMKQAFQAHTLMRKDGREHVRERMAMARAFSPKVIDGNWAQLYRDITTEYLDRLPKGETVDLFTDLCAPVAARILAYMLGMPEATDKEMIDWSQALIDGAGNFGWKPELFAVSDQANAEMNALFDTLAEKRIAVPDPSAYSIMLNAADPIEKSQIYANLKIAIGGGINEPRDALATMIYGLLTNPDQLEEVQNQQCWPQVFDEGVRWVAPIQASTRLVTEDIEIRGHLVAKGEAVMTIQASANRDEEIYQDGENFNVFRDKAPHQAFGSGPHHCAGAQVSRRTLGEIMLPALFEKFPNMKLPDPSVVKWSGFGFRGPLNLPVYLG